MPEDKKAEEAVITFYKADIEAILKGVEKMIADLRVIIHGQAPIIH